MVKKTLTSTRAYSSSSNTRVFSDGFTCVITYNNRIFKIDGNHNIVYQYTGFQGNYTSSYCYPYLYQYNGDNNYFYGFKDSATQKLIAQAKKRG
ncbi:MAG: hypothetical protein KIC98_04135 [Clostridioides difficile]|nr:hypothetical protein [Clostridioides difficile]